MSEANRGFLKRLVTGSLGTAMSVCRTEGFSFNACLAEARKQHAKEVREEALQPDRTPLTK